MGYYNGNGVVAGGGEQGRTLKSFYEWGSFAIRQKTVSSTRKYSGVSLATAQGFHSSDNLTAVTGGSGSLAWIIFDAEGTRILVSYSKIADSNLYEVNVTTETLSAWQSSTSTRRLN